VLGQRRGEWDRWEVDALSSSYTLLGGGLIVVGGNTTEANAEKDVRLHTMEYFISLLLVTIQNTPSFRYTLHHST